MVALHEQLSAPEILREDEELITDDSFDLSSFFEQGKKADDIKQEKTDAQRQNIAQETQLPEEANLLISLRDESDKLVQSFSTKVTAEAFNKTSSFVSGAGSLLSSLIGACGPLCFHGLSSIAQAGSGLSGASGLAGGLNMPGFSVDKAGNFHLDGNIDSLSRATGFSKADLLAGKFSAEDILASFLSSFGEAFGFIFGFVFVGTLIDCLFDSFLPNTSGMGDLSATA